MDKHVQKIQQELEAAKDKLEKQQHKRVKAKPLRGLCHLVHTRVARGRGVRPSSPRTR